MVSGLRFGFQWWWLADFGGSWVGDFRFAIWVSVCWSCVSVVAIWVGGFRFARHLLAVGLSWVCSPWVWFCSLWVWFLFSSVKPILEQNPKQKSSFS